MARERGDRAAKVTGREMDLEGANKYEETVETDRYKDTARAGKNQMRRVLGARSVSLGAEGVHCNWCLPKARVSVGRPGPSLPSQPSSLLF